MFLWFYHYIALQQRGERVTHTHQVTEGLIDKYARRLNTFPFLGE